MLTNSVNKLRLDLAKLNCTSFRITTQANIEDSLAHDIGLEPKRRFTRLYEEYTRSRKRHAVSLRFAQQPGKKQRYAIRILYEMEEPQELGEWIEEEPTSLKPTQAFLQLCNLKSNFLFRCDCSFYYRRDEKGIYFQLPIKIEGGIFDEVRGIRFVKLEKGNILLQNSVDLVENDLIIHRVRFAQEERCSLDLPQKLLMRARDISIRT